MLDFIYWDEFSDLIPEIGRTWFLRLSKQGKAPKTYRVTPKTKARFLRSEVESWLWARGIALSDGPDFRSFS